MFMHRPRIRLIDRRLYQHTDYTHTHTQPDKARILGRGGSRVMLSLVLPIPDP